MFTTVDLYTHVGEFAEDKDKARTIRKQYIMPSVKSNKKLVLDFNKVTNATQSFIHALISDVIRREGIDALDKIDFKNCSPNVKTIITIVCNYMQDSIDLDE